MRVRIKICGITNWRDAKVAVDAGADALGFNFYSGSARFIEPLKAAEIVRRLPRGVRAVGVFVNEDAAAIQAIARQTGIRWAQLHGEESPQTVARLARRLRVVKAFRVRRGFRVAALARYKSAAAFLLDGFSARARGGTGVGFDWSIARDARRYGRVFVAGGITPENVAAAIRQARPYAMDVCSGVESRPGKKSARKVRALLRAVREMRMKGDSSPRPE